MRAERGWERRRRLRVRAEAVAREEPQRWLGITSRAPKRRALTRDEDVEVVVEVEIGDDGPDEAVRQPHGCDVDRRDGGETAVSVPEQDDDVAAVRGCDDEIEVAVVVQVGSRDRPGQSTQLDRRQGGVAPRRLAAFDGEGAEALAQDRDVDQAVVREVAADRAVDTRRDRHVGTRPERDRPPEREGAVAAVAQDRDVVRVLIRDDDVGQPVARAVAGVERHRPLLDGQRVVGRREARAGKGRSEYDARGQRERASDG